MAKSYPLQFNVEYPRRPLDKLSTFLRIFFVIPIYAILALIESGWVSVSEITINAGYVFIPAVLMIVFRQKYPKWWFDWNVALLKFSNRILAYLFLLRDEYPSTDQEQAVKLRVSYPNVKNLNRWLPLVKWLLAVPHYIVLFVLGIASIVAILIAWFAILFTGKYPRSLFDFVVGVMRWSNRVTAYSILLVTDEYPPFSLK